MQDPHAQPLYKKPLCGINGNPFRRCQTRFHRDFPFAASKVAILSDFGPISEPSGYSGEKSHALDGRSGPFPLVRELRGRLPITRRSTNQPLTGVVTLFAPSRNSSA